MLLIRKGDQNEKFPFRSFDCVNCWLYHSFHGKKKISEDTNHWINHNIYPVFYISGPLYWAGAKPSKKTYWPYSIIVTFAHVIDKNETLYILMQEVQSLLSSFESVQVKHVLRRHNERADKLANLAIDDH